MWVGYCESGENTEVWGSLLSLLLFYKDIRCLRASVEDLMNAYLHKTHKGRKLRLTQRKALWTGTRHTFVPGENVLCKVRGGITKIAS